MSWLLAWFAPEGKMLVAWIGILGSLCTIFGVSIPLLQVEHPKLAISLFFVTVVPCLFWMWTLVLRFHKAMSLTITWGEALHSGVRWGWRRSDKDAVLGPYCPNLGHGSRLLLRSSGTDPTDGDVVGRTNPLFCPQEPSQDYFFEDATLSGIAVATARERVRIALATLGAWKGRPL